jgi:hypothetical protein
MSHLYKMMLDVSSHHSADQPSEVQPTDFTSIHSTRQKTAYQIFLQLHPARVRKEEHKGEERENKPSSLLTLPLCARYHRVARNRIAVADR